MRPSRLDLFLAAALTVACELEVLLASGADGSRLVSALAVPFVTLPLAWRRSLPLLPLTAAAIVLPAQALLDGFLVGGAVTPHAALVVALYSAGRHVAGAAGLAAVAALLVALAATWAAFDTSLDDAGDTVLTLIYFPVPLLVGRWMRGQALLGGALHEKADQLDRERERNARNAAEEERMRIATDLEGAVTGGLVAVVRRAHDLPGRLAAGDRAGAREDFASIAGGAREALADVRRVLGILRHDRPAPDPPEPGVPGHPRLTPGPPEPGVPETDVQRRDRPSPAPRSEPAARPAARIGRLDLALVASLLLGAEIELAAAGGDQPAAAITAIAIVTPLLWRRRQPVAVVVAVLAAVALQSAVLGLDRFPVFDSAAVICASFAVGAHAEMRAAVAGLALATLGAATHAAVFHPDSVVPATLGGALLPWIAGRTVRGRRGLTRELKEKAVRMVLAREQEAQAATTAERVRVARELHDAVAHNLSVIAIQAGGADGLVERDPERAAQVASLIESVGRETLGELGRLVDATAASQPSLELVDGLARRAREGGLPVELSVEGERPALPAGVDLAAYRIVQEALANVSKHAGAARARVVVRYHRHAVEVEVADDGRGANGSQPPRQGGGHGLVGIRERVALYDGTVEIGRRPGGGFLVHARLPV